ncbi:hypothetical protein HWV62_16794 [Athelia sp. TMB]|nr:hypothetical protein HWV62_16794 [Athelia sp. TMB]
MEIDTIVNEQNITPGTLPSLPANVHPTEADTLPTTFLNDKQQEKQPTPPILDSERRTPKKRTLSRESTDPDSDDPSPSDDERNDDWTPRGNRFAPFFQKGETIYPRDYAAALAQSPHEKGAPRAPPRQQAGQTPGPPTSHPNAPPPQRHTPTTTQGGTPLETTGRQTRAAPNQARIETPPIGEPTAAAPDTAPKQPPSRPPTRKPNPLDQLLDDDEEEPQPPREEDKDEDALEYTKTPEGGWPLIAYTSIKAPFQNIAHPQLSKWHNEISGGKFLIQAMFHSTGKGGDEEMRKVNQIKEILDRAMGVKNVKVSPPTPKIPHADSRGYPFSFLGWGVSEETAERLIQQRCIPTRIAGLLILPYDIARPSYLGTLDHLQARDRGDFDHLRNDIIAMWKDTKNNKVLHAITNAVSDAEGDNVDPNAPAIAHQLIDTLKLKPLIVEGKNGQQTRHCVNMYIDPPTENDKDWQAIRKAVAMVTYSTTLFGKGSYIEGWGGCHACHGEDHPVAACEFRKLDGWISSAHDKRASQKQDKPTPNDSQDTQRFRSRNIEPNRRAGSDGRRAAPRGRIL